MNPRTRTRINTPAELEAKIDRLKAKKQARKEQANDLDRAADSILNKYCCNRPGDNQQEALQFSMDAKALRNKARRLRLSASTESRLLLYKAKLAELRTGLLPGVLIDESVEIP